MLVATLGPLNAGGFVQNLQVRANRAFGRASAAVNRNGDARFDLTRERRADSAFAAGVVK